MTRNEEVHLLLKFKLAGDSQIHVKDAARIEIDGRGGLMLYDTAGIAEAIELKRLNAFSMQTLRGAHKGLGSTSMLSVS